MENNELVLGHSDKTSWSYSSTVCKFFYVDVKTLENDKKIGLNSSAVADIEPERQNSYVSCVQYLGKVNTCPVFSTSER